MTPACINDALAADRLQVLGTVSGNLPAGTGALALIGPADGFWDHFRQSPEYLDGAPDPMDRWSARVLSARATALGGWPLFPFGGPPYHPFYSWSVASGRAFASPVNLLVHDRLGLFVSYRGAIAFAAPMPATGAPQSPCPDCAQPCRTACPIGALTPDHYDVPACKAYLDTDAGQDCRQKGCLVRRACPLGQDLRTPAQSAFHMDAFAPKPG